MGTHVAEASRSAFSKAKMKVWILIQDYGWDGQTVKFVASTREAAEKLRDTYLAEYAERPDEGPRWEIEEFEIDREQEIS